MNLTGIKIDNQYEIQEQIAEGGISVVYRIIDLKKRNNRLVIKVLKNTETSHRVDDIIRFHSEVAVVSKIDHPNIVKVYESGSIKTSYGLSLHYIIMEYIHGKPLLYFLDKKDSFSIDEIIDIILQICRALEYIHDINIIHGDLKPGNIIVCNKKENCNNQYKLIDFGLSRIRGFNESLTEEIITGTFRYMSPEQSRMINRKIDERSDLYSLGIIFYQLLTGILPFKGESLIKLLQEQIAKIPESPHVYNKKIPSVIEQIVLKLLEKEPENRYQRAKGLRYDLERLKSGELNFRPGRHDEEIKINFNTNIIGREEEVRELDRLLSLALKGKGKLCLIPGEAGIGKTMLVEEFRKNALTANGLVIYGKSFERESKTPFSPFNAALTEYIKFYNRHTSVKKKNIRGRIQESCGDLGKILINLNPGLEVLFKNCPDLVELGPESEIRRFYMTITRFIYNLAEAEQGLIIIFDDLQWFDDGSLRLLYEIISDISEYPLLIVGTYRNDELTEDHGLHKIINLKKDSEPAAEKIAIAHFDFLKMNRFVSAILRENIETIKEISQFVLNKSAGNPFFSIEILKHLIVEKGLIYKDNAWELDYSILDQLEIPETILDILFKRISLLSKREIVLLSYIAAIGESFNIELLSKLEPFIADKEIPLRLKNSIAKEIIAVIDNAVDQQLLVEDIHENGKILFAHDRIRESFYERISKKERKTLHLKIARLIEEDYKSGSSDMLFNLAYHYIKARNRGKILEYAYPSALKAKTSYAYKDAIKYFSIILNLLDNKDAVHKSGKDRGLWARCMEEIGSIYLTIGKNDEGIGILNRVLAFMETDLDKAQIYKQISKAYFNKGDWKNCERYSEIGLELLGEKIPLKRASVIFGLLKELFVHILHISFPGIFVRKDPDIISVKDTLISSFYYSLNWSYVLSDILKFAKSTLRMLNFAESRLGSSKELAVSLSAYASICMAIPFFKRSLRYHNRALKMEKDLDDHSGMGQSLQMKAFCYQWMGRYKDSIDCFNKSYAIFKRIGDIGELSPSIDGSIHDYLSISDHKKAEQEIDKYIEICHKKNETYGIAESWIFKMQLNSQRGNFDEAEANGLEACKLSEENEFWFPFCTANIQMGFLYLEKNEIKKSIEYLEKAKHAYETKNLLKHYTVSVFPLLAEAYLAEYISDKNITKKKEKYYIKRLKKACRKAVRMTGAWPDSCGSALKINAKYHALLGRDQRAEKCFLKSIEHHRKLGKRYDLARSLYDYGSYLLRKGRDIRAWEYLDQAYGLFEDMEISVYQGKIAGMLGLKKDTESKIGAFINKEKISYIMKLNQEIACCDPGELMNIIIEKSVEISGAQRGYLFLVNEKSGTPDLKASINIDKSGSLEFSKGIVDDVFHSGRTILTTNAENEGFYSEYRSIAEYRLKSIICIPIKNNERIIGVCYLDNPLVKGVFSHDGVHYLEAFLAQSGIMLENLILNQRLTQAADSGKDNGNVLIDENIRRALVYLDNNYALNISREMLADILGVNPDYLGRIFRDYTGKPIREYVNDLRIKSSIDKLLNTDEQIIDIAYSAGFESLSTFNRIFQKIMGDSPSAYRKRYSREK